MTIAPDKFVEVRVKHLEMLQAIVSRMAGQGASVKSYCITLVTAVCGVAVTLKMPAIAALALLPSVIFWLLDAQYLRLERRFRALFDQVRVEGWQMEPTFSIALNDAPPRCFWSAAFSWSLFPFYLALTLGVLAVAGTLKWMIV